MSGKNLETLTGYTRANAGLLNLNILHEAWTNWHWFLTSLVICIGSAFLFLRYATPQYLITASLLIRDDSRGTEFGDAALLEDLGFSSIKSSVDNEVELLKSRSLMESVVDDLQLNVECFISGRLKTTELYDKAPFKLTFLKPFCFERPLIYKLTILGKNRYQLSAQNQSFTGVFQDTILLPQGRAILKRTNFQEAKNDQYSFVLSTREETTKKYADALSVSATNKVASMVNLSIAEELPLKGEAIMKRLILNYVKSSIEEKNRISDSTINFISRNLAEVTHELASIEKNIEHFRTRNKLLSFSEHGRLLLQNTTQYSEESHSQVVRLKILESLQKDLQKNLEYIVPSSLFQQESGFTETAKRFNEMQLLRKKTLLTVSRSHPTVQSLEIQINALRLDLMTGIISQKNELQISINAINQYNDGFKAQISRIPSLEKIYVEYTRQQEIKQELYVFLLKKQIETAISRSSTIANGRIIDSPKAGAAPTKPNKQLVLLMSGLISIALPLAFLHLKNILNERIKSKTEIIENCPIPILAEISLQKGNRLKIFDPDKRGPIAEQFRSLRTHIQFLGRSKNCQTILITSGTGGEGKSFVAMNLSHSLALSEKKVILIELDLRKPTLSYYLGLKELGFSDLLTSQTNLEDYIQSSGSDTSFDIVTSGHPPPNPVEMLALPKVAEIISSLRSKYDFVIFDTPPVGLVTDARILGQYADLSLYVVRQEVTFRHHLEDLGKIFEDNHFPELHIILNGTKQRPGYQYDYRHQHIKPNQISILIDKLKSLLKSP